MLSWVLKCVRLNGMELKWMLKIGLEVLPVECVWYEVSNVYLVRNDQVQDCNLLPDIDGPDVWMFISGYRFLCVILRAHLYGCIEFPLFITSLPICMLLLLTEFGDAAKTCIVYVYMRL